MKAGEYLVGAYPAPNGEPEVWEVEGVSAGKVRLLELNPVDLSRTGRHMRVDMYVARRMKTISRDRFQIEVSPALTRLRMARAAIKRIVDELPTAGE